MNNLMKFENQEVEVFEFNGQVFLIRMMLENFFEKSIDFLELIIYNIITVRETPYE